MAIPSTASRYSFGDAYQQILDRGVLIERLYPATDDGTVKGISTAVGASWHSGRRLANCHRPAANLDQKVGHLVDVG